MFPDSTDLVVGPGFTKSFLPGWPENPNSPILSKDTACVPLVVTTPFMQLITPAYMP